MKDKIIVFIFIGYIMLFSVTHIILKDEKISSSERRTLTSFPAFKLSGEYITDVDKYLLDHFPLRDSFRSLKANFNYHILQKLDNNDIYLKDNYIFKSEYPTNKKSIEKFINNTNKLKDMFNKNNKVYMLAIPDKNYYLEEDNFLQLDYNYVYNQLDTLKLNMIDIRDIMNIRDYYETDTHWRQEHLDKVVKELDKHMNFGYREQEYTKNNFNKFYGVYYGESAINRKPENLVYLTNDIINNAEVSYLENSKLNTVYNEDNLESLDAYEVYLDGASSFIEIKNNNSNTKKELIIFRDSFGSSITPLLIPYYSKITLIDNRYINSDNFLKFIKFNNQDVLFIYSTLIINNSFSLKG